MGTSARGWQVRLNLRPFGRGEAAYYEWVAAPAVQRLIAPVLVDALAGSAAGPVLDVGCGGGRIAAHLRAAGHDVIGLDPSVPQVRRLRRRPVELVGVAAGAGALPIADGACRAVVSSCAIKHWPDRDAGLHECARVLRPGGQLVLVEIDGGDDPGDLLRFAAETRLPRSTRRLYPGFARRTFVPISPTAEAVVAGCAAAGFTGVEHRRVPDLPFFVVTASRSCPESYLR